MPRPCYKRKPMTDLFHALAFNLRSLVDCSRPRPRLDYLPPLSRSQRLKSRKERRRPSHQHRTRVFRRPSCLQYCGLDTCSDSQSEASRPRRVRCLRLRVLVVGASDWRGIHIGLPGHTCFREAALRSYFICHRVCNDGGRWFRRLASILVCELAIFCCDNWLTAA